MRSEKSRPTNYLFQAAVGRSGSTIMRRSIGLHPDIYYNGMENNLIQDVAMVAQRNCTMQSRVKAMQVDQAAYDETFRRLICELTWPDPVLAQRPVHFAAINPTFANLDYLSQIFPGCRIVCLVRNGLEVICSRMKFPSFSGADFPSQCRTWVRCAEMLDWGEQNPERFFLFRHEWTYNPMLIEKKLEEVLGWSGLKSSSAVLNNIRCVNDCLPTTDPPQEFSSMNSNEKVNYFRAKGERWRSWSARQKDEFVRLCGGLMKRLDYSIPFAQTTANTRAAA